MLNFTNPWFLLLAPIALGPLVLHLLSRRKMKRTEFSSLFFLRKFRERRFRWLKLRDLLLLILRTLFLAFLVFALSRPIWKGRFPVPLSKADLVLIVDDSYSTSARFSKIKETADRLVSELTSGSRLAIISSSGAIGDAGLSRETLTEWETWQDKIIPSQSGRDLEGAWRQALHILQVSNVSNKQIAVVSDGQSRALDFLRTVSIPSDVEVYCFIDKKEPPSNTSVLSTSLHPRFPLPGEEQSLKIIVRSTEQNGETDLSVFADSKLNGKRVVNVGQNSKEFLFNIPAGAERIIAELEADSINADDRHFAHGAGPRKLRVALVSGADSELLDLALAVGGGVEVRHVSSPSAAGLSAGTCELLIWDDVNQPEQINSIATRGLPQLVLLGEEAVDVPGVFRVIEQSSGQGFEIMAPSELFADLSAEDMREIRFTKYQRIEPLGGRTIVSFSGGDPLLVADTSKNIYYCTVRFTPQNTNLVYRAIFPVLLQRLATYSAGQRSGNDLHIGDTLRVHVSTGEPMFVETPELHYEITPKPSEQGFLVEFANTTEPGFYTIGSETFVINPDTRESSPEKIEPANLEERGVKVFPLGASTPIKLWLFVLILAAICLTAEFVFIFL